MRGGLLPCLLRACVRTLLHALRAAPHLHVTGTMLPVAV
jgi:hypothetical protein